jgi:hypothetical protein
MQTARRSAFRTVDGLVHLDRAAGQDGTVLGQRGCEYTAIDHGGERQQRRQRAVLTRLTS